MPDAHGPAPEADQPARYQIRVRGHLGAQWKEWFEGLEIRPDESGETLLTGPVADQAALHGLLRRIRDTGLTLVSVERVDPLPGERPEPG